MIYEYKSADLRQCQFIEINTTNKTVAYADFIHGIYELVKYIEIHKDYVDINRMYRVYMKSRTITAIINQLHVYKEELSNIEIIYE